jgi:catechol 2,3-dioxygenase-like lactoylglutathione lyase family enzyme
MNVRRIGFLGTHTTNYEPTTAFFRDVLGLKVGVTAPGWSAFKLPTGPHDAVEVFGPEKPDARLFPDAAVGALVAFIVDDIVSARAEVAAAGIELLSDLIWATEISGNPSDAGSGWFFLRAPDGNIYVIEQTPD